MVPKRVAVVLSLFFVTKLVGSDSTNSLTSKNQHEIWVCHETGSILYGVENENGSGYFTETMPSSEQDIESLQNSRSRWMSMAGKQYEWFASTQIYLLIKNQRIASSSIGVDSVISDPIKREFDEKAKEIIGEMAQLERRLASRFNYLNEKLNCLDAKVESLWHFNKLREEEAERVQTHASCCECKKRKSECQLIDDQDAGVTREDIQAMRHVQRYADV